MGQLRVVVVGASGRMGRLVCSLIQEAADVSLVGAIESPTSDALGQAVDPEGSALHLTSEFTGKADVIIDFSTPDGARRAIALARECRAALVEATTGLPPDVRDQLEAVARDIPTLVAPNTSLGVTIARTLVAQAAKALGPEFDVDIVEAHHRAKRDAPSGTALALGAAAMEAGAEIGDDRYHSLRGGDVTGEHIVRFAGPGEYLEIRHVASSRRLFALGALRAAQWLVTQPPGLYEMRHVLGLH